MPGIVPTKESKEYDRLMLELELFEKLLAGEQAIARGEVSDAFESIERLRLRYNL